MFVNTFHYHRYGSSQPFFYSQFFAESNFKSKILRWSEFGGFSIAKSEGKNMLNSIFGFQCATVNIEDWLQI